MCTQWGSHTSSHKDFLNEGNCSNTVGMKPIWAAIDLLNAFQSAENLLNARSCKCTRTQRVWSSNGQLKNSPCNDFLVQMLHFGMVDMCLTSNL